MNIGEPLGHLVSRLAAHDPDAVALIVDRQQVTLGEVDTASTELGWLLRSHGVTPDDMITITTANPVLFVEATIASWKIGAIPQAVSSRLPPAELHAIVGLADPAVIVGVDLADGWERPCIPASWVPSGTPHDTLPAAVASSWKALTSGGSTGKPKLIVSTDPSRFNPQHVHKWRIRPGTTMVVPAALHHNTSFQTVLYGIISGCTVVHLTRFDERATLAAVDHYAANWLYVVPTMMSRIWRLPESERLAHNLDSLETVWHLAAPCPPWLKRAWIDWLGPERIWELYGATEAIAYTTIQGEDWLAHPESVGRVMSGRMRIVDDHGNQLPPGRIGEIFMHPGPDRGPTYRYVGADSKSLDTWESVGDMGYFDEDGYLYLADRKDDMVIVGGVNIYPAEVEAAIEQHPRVLTAVVIGLPDDDLGQHLHAIVEADGPLQPDEIQRTVRSQLAANKIPRTVEIVSERLRDDAGKVRRSKLRAARLTTPPGGISTNMGAV